MKSRHLFVMVGVLTIGLWSPMAMAKDTTNTYFYTTSPVTSSAVILQGSQNVERSVLIEGKSTSPAVIETTVSAPVIIERTVSAPVMIERSNAYPVVIEDRIIKQKHFFSIGIWPLFDFEIL